MKFIFGYHNGSRMKGTRTWWILQKQLKIKAAIHFDAHIERRQENIPKIQGCVIFRQASEQLERYYQFVEEQNRKRVSDWLESIEVKLILE